MVHRVRDAGYEIGCHSLYHETLGDPIFPLPNNWPLLPSEVEGRLREATRIVREVSGVRPVSFRCPRLWEARRWSTCWKSWATWPTPRFRCTFYRDSFVPYHPSPRIGRGRAGCGSLKSPIFADLSMKSSDQYQRDRDQWPVYRTESAEFLMQKADSFIGVRGGPRQAAGGVLLSAPVGISSDAAGCARFRREQRQSRCRLS